MSNAFFRLPDIHMKNFVFLVLLFSQVNESVHDNCKGFSPESKLKVLNELIISRSAHTTILVSHENFVNVRKKGIERLL